jgi:hypothetical protein
MSDSSSDNIYIIYGNSQIIFVAHRYHNDQSGSKVNSCSPAGRPAADSRVRQFSQRSEKCMPRNINTGLRASVWDRWVPVSFRGRIA